jgi:hypothetical protein
MAKAKTLALAAAYTGIAAAAVGLLLFLEVG